MVRKECKHTSIEADPHPYCDECAIDLRGRICTENDTCRNCQDISLDQWEVIHEYRAKKDDRRQAEKTKRLNFLHAKFGYFTKPFEITAEQATEAVEAVAEANTADLFSDSSSLDSNHGFGTVDTRLHLFSSSSDKSELVFSDMGKTSTKKPSTSEQSKKNEAGAAVLVAPDMAAQLKFMQSQSKALTDFMRASSAADVQVSPSPIVKTKPKVTASAPAIQQPAAKRSHRLSQGREKERRSKSVSRSKTNKDKSKSHSRSHKSHSRSVSSRKKSKRKRSVSSSSPDRKQRKSSRRKRSRDRSHSRRRRSFSHGRKRKSRQYSRSVSSSSSSEDSRRDTSRDRRRKRKANRRSHEKRRANRSRSRDDRSRSPRVRAPTRKSISRDKEIRHQRSHEFNSTARDEFEPYHDYDYDQQGSYSQQRFDAVSQDDGPPSDDSDAERVIVEPKKDLFPFREMIELFAKHSDIELSDCSRVSGNKHVMASDDVGGPPKPEFAALTTTVGVVSAIKLWEEEFLRKDTKRNKPVRKNELFKCDKLRSSLRSYRSGDDWANMEPLLHEKQQYSWLAEPDTKLKVKKTDVAYMELQMRNILRVANFLEVVNQTLNKGFELKFDEAVMKKLHRCGKHATGDIIKLAANMFCGLSLLRKDDIIAKSNRIPPKLASRLRHSPIGNARTMFPEDMLVEVDKVYTQKLSNQALERYATPGNRPNRGHQGGYQGGYQQGGYQQYQGGYHGSYQGGYGQQQHQSEFKRGQQGRGQGSYR